MVMVPRGAFQMGCDVTIDSECEDDESPMRSVTLDAFLMDRTEVTQASYRQCVQAGACAGPSTNGSECNWSHDDRDDHPVNCVNAEQARAFCAWAGKRLPTEAEWEKAARGTQQRLYPWGNLKPGRNTPLVANFADASRKVAFPSANWALDDYDDRCITTSPVGSYPDGASPYGALYMGGKVWEWTADWYDEGAYKTSGAFNPKGPSTGERYAIRGGSFGAALTYLRASSRDSDPPEQVGDHIGFRCAKDAR